MSIPTVAHAGSKIRVEAEEPTYSLDLWEAQEFASRLILAIEEIDNYYNCPNPSKQTRTISISARRKVTVSTAGGKVTLSHARILLLDLSQADQVADSITAAIEAVEDRMEQKGIDPYDLTDFEPCITAGQRSA